MRHISAYHYAILAPKLIDADEVGLTLILRTTLLVGVVEDFEVVVINILADTGIGN